MSSQVIYSEEKPTVIDMLNAHIEKRVDSIIAMTIEEAEAHVEKMRWEFNFTAKELARKTFVRGSIEPLETTESVLEKIKRRQPTKKQGRKRKTAREKMKALGCYTDKQLDDMGVK